MKLTQRRALPIPNWSACVKNLKSLKQVFGSKSNTLSNKNVFDHPKTRYRGLPNNTAQLSTLFGPASLCLQHNALPRLRSAAPHLPAIPSRKQDVISATTTTSLMETDARSWHLVVQRRSASLLAATADWIMGLISISPASEDVALKFYNRFGKKLYPGNSKKVFALSRYFY